MSKKVRYFFILLICPFIWINIFWLAFRICSKAKKYRLDKNLYFPEQRFKLIYKIAKRFLLVKNITIEEINVDSLSSKPKLFIGNHKSNLDPIITFVVLYKNFTVKNNSFFTFVAKKELQKNKIIFNIMTLIDGIFIKRDDPREAINVLNEQKELVKKNYSIVIFPEGTRVYSDEIQEFKPGAFIIAYQTFIPIVVFTIFGTSGLLDKNKTNVRKSKKIVFEICKKFKHNDYSTLSTISLANNTRSIVEKTYNDIKEWK